MSADSLATLNPQPSAATPATTGASPASANAASGAPQDAATDFTELLAELLGADESPAPIPNPIQAVLADEQDASGGPDLNTSDDSVPVDPALLILMLGNAAAQDAAAVAKDATSLNVDVNAGKTAGASLDATLLGALGQDISTKLTDTLLSRSPTDASSADAAKQSAPERQSGANRTDVAGAALVAQTNRTPEAREHSQVRAHVGTPAWTDELAGKLTVMIGRGLHSASLQLSPEQLGPLEIRISVQNDQTSVWFGAAHAETRAALEQALPRLRELLAGQGLNLSDAGVFREAPRDRARHYEPAGISGGRAEERDVAIAVRTLRGIVDAYA